MDDLKFQKHILGHRLYKVNFCRTYVSPITTYVQGVISTYYTEHAWFDGNRKGGKMNIRKQFTGCARTKTSLRAQGKVEVGKSLSNRGKKKKNRLNLQLCFVNVIRNKKFNTLLSPVLNIYLIRAILNDPWLNFISNTCVLSPLITVKFTTCTAPSIRFVLILKFEFKWCAFPKNETTFSELVLINNYIK